MAGQSNLPIYALGWNTYLNDTGFCEHWAWNPDPNTPYKDFTPEYLNSFSSIIMSLFALPGIINSDRLTSSMRLVLGFIFLNGPASFLFHWNLTWGWRLTDEFTMLLAITFGLLVISDTLLFRWTVIESQGDKHHTNLYHWFSITLSLILSTIAVILMIIDTIPSQISNFEIFFGIMAALLLPGIFYTMWFLDHNIKNRDDPSKNSLIPIGSTHSPEEMDLLVNDCKEVLKYLRIALGAILGAAIIWLITENLCKQNHSLGIYFFWTHVFWHVGAAWSLVTVAQAFNFLRALNFINSNPNAPFPIIRKETRLFPSLRKYPKLQHIYFSLFLIVDPRDYLTASHFKVLCDGNGTVAPSGDIGSRDNNNNVDSEAVPHDDTSIVSPP